MSRPSSERTKRAHEQVLTVARVEHDRDAMRPAALTRGQRLHAHLPGGQDVKNGHDPRLKRSKSRARAASATAMSPLGTPTPPQPHLLHGCNRLEHPRGLAVAICRSSTSRQPVTDRFSVTPVRSTHLRDVDHAAVLHSQPRDAAVLLALIDVHVQELNVSPSRSF